MADLIGGETSELIVGIAEVFPDSPFPSTAANIITSVRDMIPDQIYDVEGAPDPDSDVDHSSDNEGNHDFVPVRALYRWLTNGLRTLSQMCNWFVEDWYAFPSANKQAIYTIDPKWHNITSAFANRFRCAYLDEALKVYPSQAVAQPLWYGMHARKEPLEVFYYPNPNKTDSVILLEEGMSLTDELIPLHVDPGENFFPFGWVRIGAELIQYQQRVDGVLSTLRRGASGTTVTEHFPGDEVIHCSLWVKGPRTPRPVFRSTDILEVPLAFQAPLEWYVLSYVKRMEQEIAAAKELMGEFLAFCQDIRSDPGWQAPPGDYQVRVYGEPAYNLLYGRIIVP